MTTGRLLRVLALAAVVLALAAVLPPPAPRAALGLAVALGALLYLAAGWLPRPRVLVVLSVHTPTAVRWWSWPTVPAAQAPPAAPIGARPW